jgi:hypothetical protein
VDFSATLTRRDCGDLLRHAVVEGKEDILVESGKSRAAPLAHTRR